MRRTSQGRTILEGGLKESKLGRTGNKAMKENKEFGQEKGNFPFFYGDNFHCLFLI